MLSIMFFLCRIFVSGHLKTSKTYRFSSPASGAPDAQATGSGKQKHSNLAFQTATTSWVVDSWQTGSIAIKYSLFKLSMYGTIGLLGNSWASCSQNLLISISVLFNRGIGLRVTLFCSNRFRYCCYCDNLV